MYAKFSAHIRKALHGTILLGVAFSAFGARNLPAARTLEAGSETWTETAAPTGSMTGTIATSSILESHFRCLTSMVQITIASEQISFCAPTSLPINIVEDSTSDPYVSYAGLDQINGYGIVNIKATTPGNTPGIGRPIYNLGGVVEYRQAVWNIESSKTDRIVSNGPTGVFWNETVPSIQMDVTLPTSSGNLKVHSIEWYVEHNSRLWSFIVTWDTEMQNATEWDKASKFFFVQIPESEKLADTALDLGAVFLEPKSTNGIPDLGVPIDVGEPPWWSGICDDNNYFHAKGIHSTLLSTWHGVSVCGMNGGPDYGVYFFPGAWGVLEFECVELVMRFLYLEWGIAPWPGNANTIKNSPPGSIVFYPNGTHAIVPGDIITEDRSTQNSVGHTVIVTNVNLDDNGTGTIRILEQNASSAGHRRLSVINWQVQPDAWCFGQAIQGWLHVKTNSSLVTTISAGKRHTCWVKSDGAVACWGDNTYGQSTSPAGTFAQVSAGYIHTCGLKSDGTVACWGSNANGRATPPAGTFIQVSAGYAHTCGLRSDGTLVCWGSNANGRATPPAGTFVQVSAGSTHTCGLKSDGTVVCWGDNTDGQSAPFSISGNAGMGGTTLNYTDGSPKMVTAASDGSYSLTVSYNWSGMVTPSLTGYAFSSSSRSYTNVLANQTDQNYTATAITYTISGNAGVGGATLSYTGGTPVTAGSDGNYTLIVPYNWYGTATPSKTGYTFSPVNHSYTNVLANQTGQNYTSTAITYTISGNVDMGGATLSYTGGTPVTAGSDGNYTLIVPYNWYGTVTPSKTGYTFSPVNHSYTNVLANQTGQNYTFTAITYTISGNVDVGGVRLSYVDVTPKTVTSTSDGNYSITVPYGWSDTVTPSKTGVTFTPVSRSYTNVTTNQTGQDYAAKVTAIFNSAGAQDGWILESTETSGVGGTKDNTATTFRLGDDKLNRQYRVILSFNTASLPNTAIIQSAVLKIKQSGSPVGSNPFSVLGSLLADIYKGYFGSSSALQLTDFNATATAARVGTFNKTPVNGWYSAMLNATGCNNINKTNLTQFRLFFSKDNNDNMAADFMKFVSGNASSGKPQLIITYTLP